MVELYFGLKLTGFILWMIVTIIVLIYLVYRAIIDNIKHKMMIKADYTYHKGLGQNVAYDFQPSYERGYIKIRAREIYSKSFSKLRKWIKDNNK
jgi:hypothetical protein